MLGSQYFYDFHPVLTFTPMCTSLGFVPFSLKNKGLNLTWISGSRTTYELPYVMSDEIIFFDGNGGDLRLRLFETVLSVSCRLAYRVVIVEFLLGKLEGIKLHFKIVNDPPHTHQPPTLGDVAHSYKTISLHATHRLMYVCLWWWWCVCVCVCVHVCGGI